MEFLATLMAYVIMFCGFFSLANVIVYFLEFYKVITQKKAERIYMQLLLLMVASLIILGVFMLSLIPIGPFAHGF